jgi:hypothetical protein
MKDKLKNFKFLNEKRYKELQVIWKVGLQGWNNHYDVIENIFIVL